MNQTNGGNHMMTATLEREKDGSSYAMGYSDTFLMMLKRRHAAHNAAHLLPHLKPGMDLLDLGCGPGSITVGLAEAVHPGTVTALDQDADQLRMLEDHAAETGIYNVEPMLGDALRTGLPDGSFDAVHCHGFLMHSSSLREQLGEIQRVMRPGGILGVREMDVPTSFISPTRDSQEIFGMLADIVQLEGGDPLMGRRLKSTLLGAGFRDVEAGYGADCYQNAWDRNLLQDFMLAWGLQEEFRRLTGHRPEQFECWKQQVLRWDEHPGAIGVFNFGHAIARR